MTPDPDTLDLPAPDTVTISVDPGWREIAAREGCNSVEEWLTFLAIRRVAELSITVIDGDYIKRYQ